MISDKKTFFLPKTQQKNSAIKRRNFLSIAALGAAMTAFGLPVAAQRTNGNTIGAQLYTVRKLMQKNVADTLKLVASIGFKEVEFAGYFDQSPKQLKQILSAEGLSAPSAHAPLEYLQKHFDQVLETAVTLGHRYIVLPYLKAEQRKHIDDYKRLAAQMNHWGEACRKQGLKFAYHNHDFEFTPLNNMVPYHVLLEETEPFNVFFEMDLYWVSKAGEKPLQYFHKYPGRFPLLHFKDMAANGEITDVGKGVIDFKTLLSAARIGGFEHGFVEHDNTQNPENTLRTGFNTLAKLAL